MQPHLSSRRHLTVAWGCLDLLHNRRLEERSAQNRAELPRLVVAQFYRRGLVRIGVEAVDNAAPAVMDDDG